MAASVARTALVLTLLALPAAAQSVLAPPSPPLQSPRPAQPAQRPTQPAQRPSQPAQRSSQPARRPAQPAPRPPAQRHATPTVRPPANAPARRPAPPRKPAPPRTAVPVPVPAPTAPAEPAKPAEPLKGSNTGMPLPRFAALRSDEVNLRTGPGTRYPIEWVYKRRDLPVEIEREFEVWRLIRDPEGVKGWVHQATLVGRRTLVVTGAERVLRREPGGDAAVVAKIKPGVIGRLRSCEATSDWCQAQVQDYRGWLKRDEFWGIYPGEAVQ